jgi:hypothetical protein
MILAKMMYFCYYRRLFLFPLLWVDYFHLALEAVMVEDLQ